MQNLREIYAFHTNIALYTTLIILEILSFNIGFYFLQNPFIRIDGIGFQ